MDNQKLIKKAISERKKIEFTYDGFLRIVEPHHIGILHDDLQIHAYQTAGGSSTGPLPEWRNFKVKNMSPVAILDETFNIEKTYHPENAHYREIIIKVKSSH